MSTENSRLINNSDSIYVKTVYYIAIFGPLACAAVYAIVHSIIPEYFVFFSFEEIQTFFPNALSEYSSLAAAGKSTFALNYLNFKINTFFLTGTLFLVFGGLFIILTLNRENKIMVPKSQWLAALVMIFVSTYGIFFLNVYNGITTFSKSTPSNEYVYILIILSVAVLYLMIFLLVCIVFSVVFIKSNFGNKND